MTDQNDPMDGKTGVSAPILIENGFKSVQQGQIVSTGCANVQAKVSTTNL
ncbi:MAG: hypothetical protein ISS57_13825 [Anaerolineales bacterium]|nr:hypothetical protein [Anaerolineales bacterium]